MQRTMKIGRQARLWRGGQRSRGFVCSAAWSSSEQQHTWVVLRHGERSPIDRKLRTPGVESEAAEVRIPRRKRARSRRKPQARVFLFFLDPRNRERGVDTAE